ncbi:MAG: T9SS type A sorting domain-containing protein, partial [Candidatus Eisenbacteria bacterium]|nr:T9SS type A sorting domain-containing protein [Candidatus Eisenbacteria bacterium]
DVHPGHGFVSLTRSDGARLRAPSCLDHGVPNWRVGEVQLACKDGTSTGQYIQLQNPIEPQYHDARLRLRILDQARNELGRVEPLVPELDASRVPTGRGLLLAHPGFEGVTGLRPDALLPAALDPQGGQLVLEWLSAPGAIPVVLDAPQYGALVVPPGNAWRPHEPVRPALYYLPAPQPLANAGLPERDCFEDRCSGLWMTTPDGLNIAQPDSMMGRFSPVGAESRNLLAYDWTRLELFASRYALTGGVTISADDNFVLSGLPAGTPASFDLQLAVTLEGYDSYGSCSPNPCEQFARAISEFEFSVGDSRRSLSVNYRHDTTMVIRVQARAGEPFRVHLAASGSIYESARLGPIDVSTRVRITPLNLPSGTRLSSCWGYRTDSPVATESSLQSVAAFADRVELAWHLPAAVRVRIERREQGEFEWTSQAEVLPDGQGAVRYVDRDVRAGGNYEYRLVWQQGGVTHTSPEVSVAVPSAFHFALHGPRPNPSAGDGAVWLELARKGDVTLELFDVNGRRLGVTSRALDPGLHAIPLPVAHRLPPGVYHLRSRQGSERAQRSFIVLQ